MFEVVLNGLVLGGMYGLIALGLNLQYGIARMLNLSYGEFFTAGAFASFFAFTLYHLNPLLGLFVSVPRPSPLNWLIYRFLLLPLIRRAPNQDALDGDVVLCTFGLLFVFQGLEQVYWGGNVRAYYYLSFSGAFPRREPAGEPAAGVPRRARARRPPDPRAPQDALRHGASRDRHRPDRRRPDRHQRPEPLGARFRARRRDGRDLRRTRLDVHREQRVGRDRLYAEGADRHHRRRPRPHGRRNRRGLASRRRASRSAAIWSTPA